MDDRLIVLTGGAGFIGSNLIHLLNEEGIDQIIVVDDLGKTEKWKNLVGKRFVNIIPKQMLFDWLIGKEEFIGSFIHLGACSSTVEKDASYLLANNFHYSQRLAEYAEKHGQRFIYASSAATYGDASKGFSDDLSLLDQLEPLNMYGYSKHLFDLWVKRQGLFDRFVGLKYFNVFGPNEAHKGRMASALFHLFFQAKSEGTVRLFKSSEPDRFGDGEQKRDFIYVKDAARMTLAFLNKEEGGLFNIGSGMGSSWNQVAQALFKGLKLPAKIEYIPMPEDLQGKYQNYTCAEMAKTRELLQEESSCTPLEKAIIEYVGSYLIPDKRW